MAETTTTPAKAPRKKATVVSTVLGVVALVVLGLFGLDNWVRQQVADYVTEKVVEVLSLEADQPVTVDIAGTSVIAQVITGRIDEVGVGVDNVTIGDLTGGVRIQASGIPTDLERPVDKVQIEFTVSESSIGTIAHVLSASAIDSVVLADGEIRLASEFRILGLPLDVGVGIEPYAANGEIGFTPTSVTLNGSTTTAAALTQKYGKVASALLTTRSLCVARWLPKAITVDAVEVRDTNLVVTIGADRAILDDASLRQLGSCD